jgi:hypothetical protein
MILLFGQSTTRVNAAFRNLFYPLWCDPTGQGSPATGQSYSDVYVQSSDDNELDLRLNMVKICAMNRYLPLFFILVLACNELPVGGDELRTRGDFDPQFLELNLFSSFTEYKGVNSGTSFHVVFGANDEYQARTLLSFEFPDSSFTGLDEIKLILKIDGDFDNDTLAFSVHLMDVEFVESEAVWTKRTNSEPWQTPGGDYESDSLRYGVVEADSVILYFNYLELAQIQDAEGMIIVPRGEGFCYLHSKEFGDAPRLELKKNDINLAITAAADCYIVTGPEPALFDDWIGSGWVYRDYVKFNYDTLLDSSMAVYAELSFRCSDYFSYQDSLEIGVRQLLEPFSTFDETEVGPLIALEQIAVGDTMVTIDIVKHVQRIIDHPDSNFGFYIQISPESNDISRIELVHGSHCLNIGYVLPPEPREF